MKEDIIYKIKDQLAKDYNCSIKDFDNKDNLITDIEEVKGSRKYTEDKEIIKILIFNGKLVISADRSIKEWCKENLLNLPGEWMFLYSVLRKIDKKINEFGYEIDNTHHYYLPKDNEGVVSKGYKLKWFEESEILQFKGDNRFDEAFAFNENYPDVLAVAAVDDNDNILGMAGASKDSDIMWQIGINVIKEANGKGIASTIVRALKNEILKRGKVPFYGTIESHIISQKVALKSGFYPVFAEVKFKKVKEDKYMKFNRLIPELSVSNIEKSKNFYMNTLGFKLEYERTKDKFAFLSLGEAQIMIEEVNGYWNTDKLEYPFGRGVNFQIEVNNLEEIRDRLIKNGIKLFRDITTSEYECSGAVLVQKEFLVQDLDGYLLRFCGE